MVLYSYEEDVDDPVIHIEPKRLKKKILKLAPKNYKENIFKMIAENSKIAIESKKNGEPHGEDGEGGRWNEELHGEDSYNWRGKIKIIERHQRPGYTRLDL